MKLALSIYALLYAALTTLTVMDDFRAKKSLVEKLCDSLLMPLGLVGIVLFIYPVQQMQIKMLWRFIAPVVVIGPGILNVCMRYRIISRDKIATDERIFSDVVTIILLAPMFAANIVFAYF
jgi:hypothetical protein